MKNLKRIFVHFWFSICLLRFVKSFKIPATGGLLSQLNGAATLSGFLDSLIRLPNKLYNDAYAATTASSYPDVSAYTIGPGVSYPVVVGYPVNSTKIYTGTSLPTGTIVEKLVPDKVITGVPTDKAAAGLPPLTVIVHTDNRPINVISAPPNVNHISIRPPRPYYPSDYNSGSGVYNSPVNMYSQPSGYISQPAAYTNGNSYPVAVVSSSSPCLEDGFIPGPGVTLNCGDSYGQNQDVENYDYNGISYTNAGTGYMNPPVAYAAPNQGNAYSSANVNTLDTSVLPIPSTDYWSNKGDSASYNTASIPTYGTSGPSVVVGPPLTPIYASGVYASASSDPPDGYNNKPDKYPAIQTYLSPAVNTVADVIDNLAGQIYAGTSDYSTKGKPGYNKGQANYGSGNGYNNPGKPGPLYSGYGEYPSYPNQNHKGYGNQYNAGSSAHTVVGAYNSDYVNRPDKDKRPGDYDFEIDHNVDEAANSLFFNPNNNNYAGGYPQIPMEPYGHGSAIFPPVMPGPFYGGYTGGPGPYGNYGLQGAPPLGTFGFQTGYFNGPVIPAGLPTNPGYGNGYSAPNSYQDLSIYAKLLSPYRSLGYYRGNPFRQGYHPFYAYASGPPARFVTPSRPRPGNTWTPDSSLTDFDEPVSDSDVVMGVVLAELLDGRKAHRQRDADDISSEIHRKNAATRSAQSMWKEFMTAAATYISQRMRVSG